jgi:putative two-component system response regulator
MTKVLIVDDEQQIRGLIGELLGTRGYDCTLAADAAEARGHLSNSKFELVISDFEMPGESGLNLLQYVLCRQPSTATIMISGSADWEVAREALKIGVCKYIQKPFTLTEILTGVDNALSSD